MQKTIFLILSIIWFAIPSLNATIIRVPTDYITIQAAINSAIDGDTVLVSPGTYFENIKITKSIFLISTFFLTRDTSIISNTIIDGTGFNSSEPLIEFTGTNSEFQYVFGGFTIQNALTVALYSYNPQSGYINNCVLKDNGNNGNWATITLYGNIILDSTIFDRNRGRYVLEINAGQGKFATVQNCVFKNNGPLSNPANFQDKSVV